MLWTTPLDFFSSGLFDKDHTIRKHRSRSRDREKLQGLKSPAGSEPGKGKGKGPGVKKVPNKAASGKTVTQTKTKGMWHEKKARSTKYQAITSDKQHWLSHKCLPDRYENKNLHLFCLGLDLRVIPSITLIVPTFPPIPIIFLFLQIQPKSIQV